VIKAVGIEQRGRLGGLQMVGRPRGGPAYPLSTIQSRSNDVDAFSRSVLPLGSSTIDHNVCFFLMRWIRAHGSLMCHLLAHMHVHRT
jgi:hypothetical protein